MFSFQVEDKYLILPMCKMPLVGFGGFFGMLEPHSELSESTVQNWIESAIDLGYRSFDTAHAYRTEKALGAAVKNKIAAGTITREDVFITSKLSWDRHHPDNVRDCFEESLRNLGMDYVDQYLIHWPHANVKAKSAESFLIEMASGDLALFEENDYVKVWKILEACVNDGRAKSIGISNFNSKQVQNILDNCSIKPAVNQCEISLYHQNLKLTKYCAERGIPMVAYSPLGKCLSPSIPDTWQSPLKDPVVLELAKKYKKTAGQIALRFNIQRGVPVIPCSKNPHRQAENLQIFDFEISAEDMEKLYKLERKQRTCTVQELSKHKDYPFHEEF